MKNDCNIYIFCPRDKIPGLNQDSLVYVQLAASGTRMRFLILNMPTNWWSSSVWEDFRKMYAPFDCAFSKSRVYFTGTVSSYTCPKKVWMKGDFPNTLSHSYGGSLKRSIQNISKT